MIIESLNILAVPIINYLFYIQRFNDELKRICSLSQSLGTEGKKLVIPKQKDKTNNTKRELIKQRNFLLQENDALLFKFKKQYLIDAAIGLDTI